MKKENKTKIIEGKRAVLEAALAGAPLSKIFFANNLSDQKFIKKIKNSLSGSSAKITFVEKNELDEMSVQGSHQGVLAKMNEFLYLRIEEILEAAEQNALIIVLDHIKDSGNLGAIIRSAESVGACGVIIPNKRSASVTTSTYKSSAGAVSHMKIARVSNIARSIEKLKGHGFWVVGASEHAEDLVWDSILKGRIALVMGAEEDGISQLVFSKIDFLIKLPQQGKISCLNVAQASTVFMYEWLRQNL
ncbi:MAG: 23S rRNA (guanosine(2251)-2'-O)-methyltransferase RlmB [Eggerthellaceae bacterium]|nr:23S rRNA (guanosine(2251)-2'-O)-methyltransferase RlmB [Eggerthellaceae bacterium]